ncbi:hypothetical protein LSH36_1795g00001 [Paralvinella palmiformis]|uniref:Uncharacterized protein n=1 Tax=Paralvinella palmiformis TaxID=53620 RepID=A0AAD9ISX3_9ANNE|nr:hypothetical protein LSH36_1795g00001 [Paralvinella palmiformis]
MSRQQESAEKERGRFQEIRTKATSRKEALFIAANLLNADIVYSSMYAPVIGSMYAVRTFGCSYVYECSWWKNQGHFYYREFASVKGTWLPMVKNV